MDNKEKSLRCSAKLSDWYAADQIPQCSDANAGRIHFGYDPTTPTVFWAYEWNLGFGIMALMSAYKVFGDEKYKKCAENMLRYLKTLQIFDPFLPHAYGAIRESNPMTVWCYVRDAISAAWGFAEYYKVTGCVEYKKRAELFGEWCLKYGIDEKGWLRWGVQFEDAPEDLPAPDMRPDLHGCFHGGSLNYFYQMYKITGDKKWVGPFFERIADYLCSNIQQENGFFITVEAATGKVAPNDPQGDLHRGNDDLNTLGLLCAYKIYRKQSYLDSIKKFLDAVFAKQDEDGFFESGAAALAVILNVVHEAAEVMDTTPYQQGCEKALQALFTRQFPDDALPNFAGGLHEDGKGNLCVRSMGYALIYLLKKYGNDDRFLSCK